MVAIRSVPRSTPPAERDHERQPDDGARYARGAARDGGEAQGQAGHDPDPHVQGARGGRRDELQGQVHRAEPTSEGAAEGTMRATGRAVNGGYSPTFGWGRSSNFARTGSRSLVLGVLPKAYVHHPA